MSSTKKSNSIAKLIKLKKLESEGLTFPHATSRLSGSTEPTKTEWFTEYMGLRRAVSRNIVSEVEFEKLPQEAIASESENRIRGALIGCALGDALGTTLEFTQPGAFTPIDDIVGGGPFGLKAGEWTDDTSMMYCLAHSLVRTNSFDLSDQIELYCRWREDGVFSVNGHCFDIGNTVSAALDRYRQTGDPISGDTSPMSAGNGSLMRLAPVPIRYFNDFSKAVELSGKSSLTTHGATEAVDACRYYGALIWGGLHGVEKSVLLNGLYSPETGYWNKNPLCESINLLVTSGSYKAKKAKDIRASGYVLHTLEAALWAFENSHSFEEGALMAVNLGEDADTTGAVYGQLAGAYYGERALPINWIDKVKEAHVFFLKAKELCSLISSD
ncbi:ADP-ribosylglycohydrolase family protein [Agaribacterium sp. ZY112]|uniref:ADP-ribosylglycohydrolase family protein n=1 Tax=Agaribacterium sp. ZY112 TaxID=3233574 RepID=UPI003525866C